MLYRLIEKNCVHHNGPAVNPVAKSMTRLGPKCYIDMNIEAIASQFLSGLKEDSTR